MSEGTLMGKLSRSRRRGLAIAVGAVVLVLATSLPASAATTARLNVSSGGAQANGGSGATYTSGSGRFVVFESDASNLVRRDTNGVSDIFLRDRSTGKTGRISVSSSGQQANGPSHSARGVTPDGRYVVFESFASNLVPNDTNGTYDVFIRD